MRSFKLLSLCLLLLTVAVLLAACGGTDPAETTAPETTAAPPTTSAPTTSEVITTVTSAVPTTATPTTAVPTTVPPATSTPAPQGVIIQKVPADIDVFVFDGKLNDYIIGYETGADGEAMTLENALGLRAAAYDAAIEKSIHLAIKTDGIVPLAAGDYHIYMTGKTLHILAGDVAGLADAVDAFLETVTDGVTSHSQYLHTVYRAENPVDVETIDNYINLTELIGETTENPLSYKLGDEIIFVLTLKTGTTPTGCTSFRYRVQADDTKAVLEGTVSGKTGVFAITVPASFTLIPGSVRLSVDAYDSKSALLPSIYSGTAAQPNTTTGVVRPNYSYIGGAVVDAANVTSDVPSPDNFAEFWAEQLSTLPMPARPKNSMNEYANGFAIYKMDADYLTALGYASSVSRLADYDIYEIYLYCGSDRVSGRPAVGYVSVPKNARPNSLPIVVGLNAYGTRDGYLGFDPNSILVKMHPNGMPKAYYDAETDSFTPTDFAQDNGFARYVADYDDPATAYLTYMLLRNVQMLRFLTDDSFDYDEDALIDSRVLTNMEDFTSYQTMRAAYNGKISFSYGGSMGGFQNVGTAALCMMEVNGERLVKGTIQSIVVGCPWMCDPIAVAGASGRLMGLGTRIGTMPGDSLEELNLLGLSYFDTVHFGALLTEGKIEIQGGFADTTCPSSGILSLYNAVKIQKSLYMTQNKDHSGKNPNADGNAKGALTTSLTAPAAPIN